MILFVAGLISRFQTPQANSPAVSKVILLANSRRRPISRSLDDLGTLEDWNPAPWMAQTNSPAVSMLGQPPEEAGHGG